MPRPTNTIGPAGNTRLQASRPTEEVSSQEIFSMADVHFFKPSKFKGQSNEDAVRWLAKLEEYFLSTKKENEQKLPIFALLLEDNARDWYDALPIHGRRDFDTLKNSFEERYVNKLNNWEQAASLFQSKQMPNENILDFISNTRRKALVARVPESQAMQAVLHGMNETYRPFILQHNPQSVEDIIKHAMTLENSRNSKQVSFTQPEKVQSSQDSLLQAMTELSINIGHLAKGQMETVSVLKEQIAQGQMETIAALQSISNPRGQNSGHYNYRYNNNNNYNRSRTPDRDNRSRQSNYRSKSPQDRQRRGQFQECASCGKYHNRATCSFRDAECHRCHKIGHIQTVCRSTGRQ